MNDIEKAFVKWYRQAHHEDRAGAVAVEIGCPPRGFASTMLNAFESGWNEAERLHKAWTKRDWLPTAVRRNVNGFVVEGEKPTYWDVVCPLPNGQTIRISNIPSFPGTEYALIGAQGDILKLAPVAEPAGGNQTATGVQQQDYCPACQGPCGRSH